MKHFIPDKWREKQLKHEKTPTTQPHTEEPPYTLYNIGLSNLKPHDKIRRYWISFRDPVDLKTVEAVLQKYFPIGLRGYAGMFQIEQVLTCWVELEDYMNWRSVKRYTIAALMEVC